MKKYSFFPFNALQRSAFCLMLVMSTLAVGFTSCSDDDEEGDRPAGGPYPGVWEMTHIKIVEDGEPEEGELAGTGSVVKLTLLENGTYSYYAFSKGDTEEEDELLEDNGKWTYSDQKLMLKNEMSTSTLLVRTWTPTKLVTYQEENEDGYTYSETRTWQKK